MDIVTKAVALVEACETLVLASVDGRGYPRPCAMAKVKADGIKTIWVDTGFNSKKTGHFMENDKAGVTIWQGGDSMTLLGTVSVHTDAETRKAMWVPGFEEHFPGGVDDSNYCVLRFDTVEATLWIDNEFVTVGADAL